LERPEGMVIWAAARLKDVKAQRAKTKVMEYIIKIQLKATSQPLFLRKKVVSRNLWEMVYIKKLS
jgi:hypothetical protein